MSAGLINAVRDLTKRIEALEGRNTPVTGALEAVLALIETQSIKIGQLSARMEAFQTRLEAQEQRRGPGRPPKDRDGEHG